MSWESSIEYERIVNEEIRARLGGMHSPDLLIRSYDFDAVERLQAAGEWHEAGRLLASDADRLQQAGAEIMVLCTNTMHRVGDKIEDAIDIPFLHLADATAAAVLQAETDSGAPLRTRFTMEHDFYRGRLESHGLEVMIPDETNRKFIHTVLGETARQVASREVTLSGYKPWSHFYLT